ncbi:RNA-binding region RNP-1 domain-containing protein [Cavenderia fasciculata]|uniref:RNA-binding region RNP-1 domain-containing protein n=1 Tax=Cavenderia fasciculata TaxID=261658 RepID=F4PH26_CACFS|nr:RNA-binding region RNP-1 domain-containing protein [Cavenderia fasciculata]EGG25010.1 RNA-binding region RNP-1 domain-containing protein [Cavenderia fasciculata]|eukprot:XP_004362861.1 RNA-binding region RNP-1 domain-containing protein [Cavenderia fasciculata]
MVSSIENTTESVVSLPDNAAVENLSNSTPVNAASSSSSSSSSPTTTSSSASSTNHGGHHHHHHNNSNGTATNTNTNGHNHNNHHHNNGHYAPHPHMIMHHPMMMQPYHGPMHPAVGHYQSPPPPPPLQFTSLYVGDLSQEVNELILAELFSKVGRTAVASIHVCRDSATLRSLGYAYVNFYNSVDAERALDTLNYSLILGRPCRIMWSHRDPTKRKSNVGNIFVKNLEKNVDNALLFDTFSTYGNILSCKIEYEKGISKGYGYVHFENQESSEQAILKVNGTILLGKPIIVEPFVSKVERFKEKKNENKLFIKNIDENVTSEMLQQELSRFGEIESCNIRTDPTGKPKGLAFVEFKTSEDAQALLESTEAITILSKQITFDRIKNKVERSIEKNQKLINELNNNNNNHNNNNINHHINSSSLQQNGSTSQQQQQNLTLFINNIDMEVDKEIIREEFAKHGNILGIKIKSRGFAFLTYSTQEEAAVAIEKMNGYVFGTKALVVSLSNSRKEKRIPSDSLQGPNPYMYMPYVRGPYQYQQAHYYPAAAAQQQQQQQQQLSPSQQQQNSQQPRGKVPFKSNRPISLNPNNQQQPNSNMIKPSTNGYSHHQQQPRKPRSPTNTPYNNTTTASSPATKRDEQPSRSPSQEESSPSLNVEELKKMTLEDVRDAVGSFIYNIVSEKESDKAPKITGMILSQAIQQGFDSLIDLLDQTKLSEKIQEAIVVLNSQDIPSSNNDQTTTAAAAVEVAAN